jgi:hypothetical protein
MRRGQVSNPQFREMLARSPARTMTPAQRERQLISFAYGNAKLEDRNVTRALVQRAFDSNKK